MDKVLDEMIVFKIDDKLYKSLYNAEDDSRFAYNTQNLHK